MLGFIENVQNIASHEGPTVAADRFGELLGRPVKKAGDTVVGPAVSATVQAMKSGDVVILENLRFDPREQKNDPDFANQIAALGDAYVNDAFGTAHRAHASTVGMVSRVKEVGAGDLLCAELEHLRRVLDPARPFLCLLGGAKVSDKLSVLEAMVKRADVVCVGGAMAYTFLRAQGIATGKSLVPAVKTATRPRVGPEGFCGSQNVRAKRSCSACGKHRAMCSAWSAFNRVARQS